MLWFLNYLQAMFLVRWNKIGNFVYNNIATDESLIERVKNGDCEAFTPLIERYKLAVYRLIYRMVSNRDDTEDLVQEVFIKTFGAIKTFKPGSRFYPWLSRIAVNHTINYLKREQRDKIQPLEWVQDRMASEKNDPVEMTRHKILKEKILMAMQKLPTEYQAILVLRVEEELSYDEISEVLKIPRGTVMSRLSRARQKLKEIFKIMGVQPI